MRHAPPGAFFLVLTHEHALDLRIVEAILRRGDFAFCGLIGSKTKRAKFVHRLEERGVAAERIARLTCPIGVAGIDGKEPEVIAAGVIAQLLLEHSRALRTIDADDDETTLPAAPGDRPAAAGRRRRRTSTGCSRTASPPPRLSRSASAHRVGTGWPGETLPRDPARIVRFALVDALGERPIEGEPGADPAGTIALRRPGIAIALYRSRPSPVRLEAEAFESYLRDEGLDRVVAARAAHGESQQPGVEIFSRNAKAMLVAPGPADRRQRRAALAPAGRPDPRARARDRPAPARRRAAVRAAVLYRGKPLAGALVKAYPKDGNERRLSARTDAQGRVRFVLPEGGVWLISAVHMIDAPAASGARWESLWSSLTFDAGAGSSTGSAPRRRHRRR